MATGDRHDLDALAEVARRSLGGEPVGAVLDRLGDALDAVRPGHRAIVVGDLAGASVHGRHLDIPRRVRTVLDRVVAGLDPGRPATHGAAVRASAGAPPWDAVVDDLADAGLGPPLLVGLRAGDDALGLLAVFPLTARSGAPDEPPTEAGGSGTDADPAGAMSNDPPGDGLDLGPWADIGALVLARARDQDRSRRATVRDEITGLPSAGLLAALVREALHRHARGSVTVVQVGLDRIDRLADAVGEQQAGDLLRAVAGRVRAAVRPDDVVGHTRGGDLIVLAEGLDGDEAGEVAERIRSTLAAPLATPGDRDVALTPGVGFVVAGPDDTVDSLLHKAGMAVREAASTGGSEAVRYRPGTLEAARERVDIEHDLRRVLDADGLTLAYQPQVSLVDGVVLGVEALVRWDRAGQGPIAPEIFIPVAEDTGLVVELGRWAIDRVVADLAAGLPVVASVNLSTRQLDEPSLLDDITSALGRHDVAPERLRLEVTESTLARDPHRGESLLRRLRDLGVRVAIDDFGTGYAGLENLRRTEVAESVKIDRAFVTGVAEDPRDRAIVAAAVTLGRALGVTVVAEGVETEAQARVLAGLGCDAAQGFWFGPPVPLRDLDLAPRPLP